MYIMYFFIKHAKFMPVTNKHSYQTVPKWWLCVQCTVQSKNQWRPEAGNLSTVDGLYNDILKARYIIYCGVATTPTQVRCYLFFWFCFSTLNWLKVNTTQNELPNSYNYNRDNGYFVCQWYHSMLKVSEVPKYVQSPKSKYTHTNEFLSNHHPY